ncbi:class I SAM-dependent methyltransferase [Candidatus Magnetaquicoccus inordinatus]|uniref:class I SAM-dependent methyltransferase n=1 Tax=Candidatus Magnetaquicoccus inordinatus TaxID=2496818 RepID=UPI00102BC834|nr:class I SAM-dependent methyltransferase [Candidatus Magnetaquicoccus inordinatus]
MGECIDFNLINSLRKMTKRDYTERVCKHDKLKLVQDAMRLDQEYWDGDRMSGYGGYRYIPGRWTQLASSLINHYQLDNNAKILEIGCGKGFLLYEFSLLLPGVTVCGIDASQYSVAHGKEEIRESLQVGSATDLPFADAAFDLVVSLNTLQLLTNYELFKALKEIERVSTRHKWLLLESYRNEEEKLNMLNWQLIQRTFYRTDEWEWFMDLAGYSGDYAFTFYE